MRHLLAQLISSDDLESIDASELRAMLADLDSQTIYGEDVVEVSL